MHQSVNDSKLCFYIAYFDVCSVIAGINPVSIYSYIPVRLYFFLIYPSSSNWVNVSCGIFCRAKNLFLEVLDLSQFLDTKQTFLWVYGV